MSHASMLDRLWGVTKSGTSGKGGDCVYCVVRVCCVSCVDSVHRVYCVVASGAFRVDPGIGYE